MLNANKGYYKLFIVPLFLFIAYINALILFLLAVHMKVKYYSGLMVLQFVEFCICSCNVGWLWFIIIVIMGG